MFTKCDDIASIGFLLQKRDNYRLDHSALGRAKFVLYTIRLFRLRLSCGKDKVSQKYIKDQLFKAQLDFRRIGIDDRTAWKLTNLIL
jgi:hypothetical protein